MAYSVFAQEEQPAEVVERQGAVDYAKPDMVWRDAEVGQQLFTKYSVRTLEDSRATIRLSNLALQRMGEKSRMVITGERQGQSRKKGINLLQGFMYFFSREAPDEVEIATPLVSGALRGTEFSLEVSGDGTTLLTLFDGAVALSNSFGSLNLGSGEQAVVEPGQAPRKTAVIVSQREIQWCLYYPAVVDPREFSELGPAYAGSLSAYRRGNLLKALDLLPKAAAGESGIALLFRACLLLSVGQIDDARLSLDRLPAEDSRVQALRVMMAAVTMEPSSRLASPSTSSLQLAASYLAQSNGKLGEALSYARAAVADSPQFGFAWARVAELEFSFANNTAAREALEKALSFSPENAQAHAVHGFIRAGENRIEEAMASFNRAIELDPGLGNGWLGRGLCAFYRGERDAGLKDIHVATVVEPNRAFLRSYLAKAFEENGDLVMAQDEARRAIEIDPGDPTAYLYRALIQARQNKYIPAIRSLEESQARNENRQLYRSKFLLDKDEAVRGANLAKIYKEAGMEEVAQREAAVAVSDDYTNFSSHLFLANTFDDLRDPRRVNLRYETAWFNELLLANLLAPVGANSLSQYVSQQEYSGLFRSNGLGGFAQVEAVSDRRLRSLVSQYGVIDNFSYSIDGEYSGTDFGGNEDFDLGEVFTTFKWQPTAQDGFFFQTKWQWQDRGDTLRYANPAARSQTFNENIDQMPILLAGYHRMWSPEHHTLLLGARLVADDHVENPTELQRILLGPPGPIFVDGANPFDREYHADIEIYSFEAQHIWEEDWHRLILGGRIQNGEIDADASFTNNPIALGTFYTESADDLLRYSTYGYVTVEPLEDLKLTGGIAYDGIRYPENFRRGVLSDQQAEKERISPKAALVYDPNKHITLRGFYAHALGGVTFDESVRLEPVQLAGFNQAFRSIIPESVIGSVEAPTYRSFAGAVDLRPVEDTYVGFEGGQVRTRVRRTQGIFTAAAGPPVVPAQLREEYDFDEWYFLARVHRLIGDEVTVGATYQLTLADLHSRFPSIPTTVNPAANRDQEAILHQPRLFALWQHSSGFYLQPEIRWTIQNSNDTAAVIPDESFPQLNLFAGYRFWQGKGEVQLGVLNITGDDHRVNPLNFVSDYPESTEVSLRVRMQF